MKKSLKLIATVSVLSLLLFAMTACTDILGREENTTLPQNTEPFTSQNTTEKTTEEETTTTQSTSQVKSDTAEDVIELIKTFPVGTAGSTAKCVETAVRLINLAEKTDSTEEIKTEVEKLKESLSDREKAMFEEGFAEIDYVARKLINGNVDSYKAYLEGLTAKYDKGNYSLEKYEAVFKIISEI